MTSQTSNLRYDRYRKPYFVAGADGALVVRGQPVPKSLQLMLKDSWLVRLSGSPGSDLPTPRFRHPDHACPIPPAADLEDP